MNKKSLLLICIFVRGVALCTTNPWQIIELLTNLTTPQIANTKCEVRFRYTCYVKPQRQQFMLLFGDELIAYENFFFSEHIIDGVHQIHLAERFTWEYIPYDNQTVDVVVKIDPLKYQDFYRLELSINYPEIGVGLNKAAEITNIRGGPTFCGVNSTLPAVLNLERNISTNISAFHICGNPMPMITWSVKNISSLSPIEGILVDESESMYKFNLSLPRFSRDFHMLDIVLAISGYERLVKRHVKINMTSEPLVLDDVPDKLNITENQPTTINSIIICGNPAPVLHWNISSHWIGTVNGKLKDELLAMYEYNISLPAIPVVYNGSIMEIVIVGYKNTITRHINLRVQPKEKSVEASIHSILVISIVCSAVIVIISIQCITICLIIKWRRDTLFKIQREQRRNAIAENTELTSDIEMFNIHRLKENMYERILDNTRQEFQTVTL